MRWDGMRCALATVLMALLLSPAFAQFEDFAVGLPASIVVQNNSLDHTPALINVRLDVRNAGGQDWTYYLLSNKNGTWKSERVLGVLQPGEEHVFGVDLEATYKGKSVESTQYALVAAGNAVPLGQYFKVEEDWRPYERLTRRMVEDSAMVFVPVAGILIFLLLLALADWAYVSRAKGEYSGEYTMKTLMLPRVKNRPRAEILSQILLHPTTWLVEIGIAGLMAKLLWDGLAARQAQNGLSIMLLSVAGALLVPFVYFFLAWIYNEQVEKMPLRFLAGMFFFGGACAVGALYLNTFHQSLLGWVFGGEQTVILLLTTAMFAPLVEELLKGAGLLVLSGHHEFSDALHGLHLGFAVGLGFSFVENWFYFASRTDPFQSGIAVWAGLVVYRSFFNSISHAFFSASLGMCLGWAKSQEWGRMARLAFIPGLATAVALHSIFNITATLDGFMALSNTFWVYVFNPTLVIIQMGLLIGMLVMATADHKELERVRKQREMLAAGGRRQTLAEVDSIAMGKMVPKE